MRYDELQRKQKLKRKQRLKFKKNKVKDYIQKKEELSLEQKFQHALENM